MIKEASLLWMTRNEIRNDWSSSRWRRGCKIVRKKTLESDQLSPSFQKFYFSFERWRKWKGNLKRCLSPSCSFCVCVCLCVWERESVCEYMCIFGGVVCRQMYNMCVWEKERGEILIVEVYARVCVCVWERECVQVCVCKCVQVCVCKRVRVCVSMHARVCLEDVLVKGKKMSVWRKKG